MKIFGIGMNYRDHAEEMKRKAPGGIGCQGPEYTEPVVFTKCAQSCPQVPICFALNNPSDCAKPPLLHRKAESKKNLLKLFPTFAKFLYCNTKLKLNG